MAYLSSLTFAPTGDPIIDAATQGSVWDLRSSNTISWALADGFFGEFWISPEETVAQLSFALGVIAQYANLNFEFNGYYTDPVAAGNFGADIVYSLDGDFLFTPNENVWAVGNFPFATAGGFTNYDYATQPGDIFLNIQSEANYLESYDLGSSGWYLILHETLHALGLKHTFDRGNVDVPRPTLTEIGLDPIFDADWFSVMSYAEDYPLENTRYDPATPMLLDLLALQYLYGANPNTGAGNDTYQLDGFNFFSTIWDASGLDRVDATGASEGWTISLPDLQLSTSLSTLAGVALPYLQDPRSNSGIAPQDLIWLAGDIENATGSSFNDLIEGSRYANDLKGGAGNDTLHGFEGDDNISGQSGIDTAVFSGEQSSYTLQFSPSGTTIADRRPSGDGIDTLISIENLEFADGAFDIGIRSGAVDLSTEEFESIVELYIAYFNRAPAALGLTYWATRLEDGMTLPRIAQSFFEQPEIQRTYEAYLNEDGSLSDTEAFVTTVFNNVLGRDPSGPYWINELENNPAITPAIFILSVLNGAKAPTGGALDRVYLADKTDIGVYFSAIKGLSEFEDTVAVMEMYTGTHASVNEAVAAVDQIHAEALDPIYGEFLMPLVGVIDDPFALA